ncbi:MAG: SGNH/GDSL hydrolase family protein [Paenibacillaceae bacterium]|nr:SGNH/GDSL hydrolase family protein [Paenibacillaceae bacterium]
MAKERSGVNATQLDANMRVPQAQENDVVWHSPQEQPFQIAGFGWLREEARYRRLPAKPEWTIPDAVDQLANCTAGGQIRFLTNTGKLSLKVKLAGPANMYHMPATGQCGFDCYIDNRYCSTTRYNHQLTEYECVLFAEHERRTRLVTLNMPLYQGVEEVWIGLDPDASVASPPAYDNERKIVIYGTSITQGGCAMRPGMAYPNIMSRRINLEFVNLGFSGSGKGEPELARLCAQIADPACFVLDYEANCVSTELLAKTLPDFVSIYREKHPLTPILIVSRITYSHDAFNPEGARAHEERKRIQQGEVERRRQAGDGNIYFYDGDLLLGDGAEECTVDGVHPTDLGFLRMAEGLTPVLKQIVGG